MATLPQNNEEYIPRYSYKDYLEWEGKWELINGVAYAMSPAPVIKHQEISFNIALELKRKSKSCKFCKSLQAVDWKTDFKTVVCPDNLLVCGEDIGGKHLTTAPEIIFEILSQSTMFKDRNVKYQLYEKMGVKYYILVDGSALTAEVFELIDDKYEKIKNAQDDIIEFKLDSCDISFDFSKIWE